MFSGLTAASTSVRRWTALASFILQGAFVTAILLFPMIYPQKLPPVFLNRRIFVPMSNGEVRAEIRRNATGPTGAAKATVFVVRRDAVSFGKSLPVGSVTGPEAPELSTDTGPGPDLGPLAGVGTAILPRPPAPAPRGRVSEMMEGNLRYRVEPQYPAIAKQIRLQGAVVLKAIISREGTIERVEVSSGPPLLARSAEDAVRQWKYRPYFLNGEPVEVETQITVNFVLDR